MADRLLNSIRTNRHNTEQERTIKPADEILIRLYALLHDVPHIPYGHTLEDELGILKRHDENEERLVRFFGPKSQIGSIVAESLGQATLENLMKIYRWDKESPLDGHEFIHDIVSNTVCADLLDYLARDNLFCNLGVPLEYRFINFLYLHQHRDQTRVFVRLLKHGSGFPRRDTLTDLCRLLETRYLIAERVYFHHAKIASSAMLGRAVYESIEAGELTEDQLYDHTDDSVIHELAKSKAKVAKRLAKSLWDRQLHKQVHKYQRAEFEGIQAQDHRRPVLESTTRILGHPRTRTEFENRLAAEIGVDEGDILVYCPPEKMNLKVARMNVIWKGKEMEFGEIDDSTIGPRLQQTLSAHKQLWGVWLLASPTLDDHQRRLAREAFDLEFLTAGEQDQTKRREYYGHLVDRALQEEGGSTEAGTPKMYQQRRGAVIEDILAPASRARPFKARLASSIKRHFSNST